MSTDGSQTRPPDCLSDFVLDRLVARDLDGQPEEAVARRHLVGCARCTARLAAFEAVELPSFAGLESKAVAASGAAQPATSPVVPQPTISPVIAIDRAARRRRWALPAAATGFAVAASVAALFLLRPPTSPDDDSTPVVTGGASTRIKGAATLAVIARRPSGETVRLGQGDAVAPGDALRFEVAAAQAGYVAVIALDAAGQVTPYAPPVGAMLPIAGGPPAALPGSVIADQTLGMELIVAFVCAQPRPLDELRAAARAALARAGNDPRQVTVGGLATGCVESAFSIDKRRP